MSEEEDKEQDLVARKFSTLSTPIGLLTKVVEEVPDSDSDDASEIDIVSTGGDNCYFISLKTVDNVFTAPLNITKSLYIFVEVIIFVHPTLFHMCMTGISPDFRRYSSINNTYSGYLLHNSNCFCTNGQI